jgi:hypothetical protein
MLLEFQECKADRPSSESGSDGIFLDITSSPTVRVSTATEEPEEILIIVPSITQHSD